MINELTFEVASPPYAKPLPIPEPSEPFESTVQFTMIKDVTVEVASPPSAYALPIPDPPELCPYNPRYALSA
jgi:hypothetical protein